MFAQLAFLVVAAAAPCRASGALKLYLEPDRVGARDTIASARLCLTIPERGTRIASVSGRLSVDTSFAKVADVVRPARSPFFANADSAGNVLIAGAAGAGVRGGTLLTLRLRLTIAGVVPKIELAVTELNAVGGRSEVTRATTAGLAPQCVGARPAIFEVLPPAASADPGEPLDLRINGCGFSATRNTVRFGELTLTNIPATQAGTRIRVVVQKEYRSSSEVPPMQMGPGEYDVSVDNGRGKSNARHVTLR